MRKLLIVPVLLAVVVACQDTPTQPLAPGAALMSGNAATVEVTGDVGWTNPQGLEQTASFGVITQRDNLRGEVASWRQDGVDWYSDVVSCFEQVGNSAVFAGPITGGTDAGRYYQIRVTDNGPGGSDDPRDLINVGRSNNPLLCDIGLLPATSEVHTGNLKLHQYE
jgi:hypothetical protein